MKPIKLKATPKEMKAAAEAMKLGAKGFISQGITITPVKRTKKKGKGEV